MEKTLNFFKIYLQFKILQKSPTSLQKQTRGRCILTKKTLIFLVINP